MPAPEDPERGLIGIMRDNSFAYKPVMNFIEWNDPNVSMFLLWLWMISFFHRNYQHASITNFRWRKIHSYNY